MMPCGVVTPPLTWYRNISICNRKQAFTTVSCLVVLTVCFTYYSFNHHGWRVRLVPDKHLHQIPQHLYQATKPLVEASPTKTSLLSQYTDLSNANKKNVNRSFTYTEKSVVAADDIAIKDDKLGIIQLPGGSSTNLDVPPHVAQPVHIPDRNSIQGSLRPRRLDQVNVQAENNKNYIEDSIIDDSREEITDSILKDSLYYHDFNTDAQTDYRDSATSVQNDYTTSVLTVRKNDQSVAEPRSNKIANSTKSVSDLYQVSATRIHPRSTVKPGDQFGNGKSTTPLKTNALPHNQSFLEPLEYDSQSDDSSWQMTRNSWTKATTEKEEIFYNPQEVDLMSTEKFDWLKDYKNPCWSENVNSWYMDNVYLEVKNVRAVLTSMSAILRLRQEHGDHHRIRCLPYFFIIGQPKCGSTDLYEKLMAHPDAVRPPTKEPHWWTRTRLGRHRAYGHIVTLSDYVDLFDYAAYNIEQHPAVSDTGSVYHKMITGEGSMSTFWDNDHWWAMVGNENTSEPRVLNPDNLHHVLPDTKLILILRNPTTRMYSDYLYFRKEDKIPMDFHKDVVNAISVYDNCSLETSLRSCVYNSTINSMAKIRLRVGMYAIYMRDWLRVFPREQFFIVRTEIYAANPKGVIRELYKFLGLGELSETHENRILSRKKANTRRVEDKLLGDMLPETKTLLDNFYQPLNKELATLLNDNQFLWEEIEDT